MRPGGPPIPLPRVGFHITAASADAVGNPNIFNKDSQSLSPVLDDRVLAKTSEEDIAKALSHVAKLDNPNLTHFDSSPCVSCHISSGIVSEVFIRRQIELKDDMNLYTSKHNLQLVSKGVRRFPEIRNFSSSKAISQRTVNESAEVVDAILKHGIYK